MFEDYHLSENSIQSQIHKNVSVEYSSCFIKVTLGSMKDQSQSFPLSSSINMAHLGNTPYKFHCT